MMAKLTRESLQSLESYAKNRPEFRAAVMLHKKNRQLDLNDHITLLFEDELTIRYQVQEMLRSERIFEEAGIQDELNAYNPLIPDGSNWKATMLISYPDIEERKKKLAELVGIEHKIWVQVEGNEKVYGIADEDLERSTENKTSAVHFLRFELSPGMIQALKSGAALAAGIDHPVLTVRVDRVPEATRKALIGDLSA